jgi:hypothetical protein
VAKVAMSQSGSSKLLLKPEPKPVAKRVLPLDGLPIHLLGQVLLQEALAIPIRYGIILNLCNCKKSF